MQNERYLFTFCTLTFIVISCSVLYVAWTNSLSIHKQGWSSVSRRINQHTSGMKSIHVMNLERQATVREFCKQNNRSNETVNTKKLDNIIVDEKFKILFCYIPKVSCSQWKTVMASLNRTKSRNWIHDAGNFKFLHQYPTDEAEKMLKSYFKFVFVREPFERLLSAYLDKFYGGQDPGFHKNFGQEIIRRYRPGGKPEDKNITFDEFVNYVINIGDGYWNEHWKTYDKLCYPCGVHYDFIGRFENLEDEARYVLEISGINTELNISFPQVKPSSTFSKVPFFYSQIAKERLYRVVQLFEDDSEMFGYDLPNSFYEFLAI
ncbi:carbohydrate sulfotransferase 11-like [Oculina patagonica]